MDLTRLSRNHLIDQNFGMCITPQDLILPHYSIPGLNYYRPWKWCMESGIKDFGSTIDNQREKYKISLDVQHFLPNEISVKVTDKDIVIEGKHEEREDEHGIISRQFKRRYILPSDCLSENISSTLSSDGILTVIANKKVEKDLKNNEITVPIQICGACPQQEKLQSKLADEKTQMQLEDIINNNAGTSKMNCSKMRIVEKDINNCNPKPEIIKESAAVTADKILMEARKETDSIFKTASDMAKGSSLENIMQKSTEEMVEMTKMKEQNIASMTETCRIKSTVETLESEERSSFKSLTSSTTKLTGEQISEFVSDVISAELREAAENM